ncbi:MAG: dTDP-4-dehydrorhamnose 3,5-epimerase [Candidatus Aenigmarchaeota archaeon]|nr:dTDP-4-dehydrorhamnose 3,5-epimerase [Candidatus Aenigmarchaeota archaeon]
MPFTFERLAIPDVVLVKPHVHGDERGFFIKFYDKKAFEQAGIRAMFIEDSHTRSASGVLRGLHFQSGAHAEAKLVRCIRGEVYDVAVDLRKGSPTFGKHVAVTLSADNKNVLFIPRGFAHGFVVVSKEDAEMLYKIDNAYAPEHSKGLAWNDTDVNIKWPVKNPVLSDNDKKWPTLANLKELPHA